MNSNADDLSLQYADWKAPRADGSLLIWPEPQQMLDDARATRELLSRTDSPPIQGVPLLEWRQRMRAFLGHADDAQPLIVTGHQAELHHPGVWAKNALVDAAARAIGARAMHLSVDTDQPKHLTLRWPGFSESITDDASRASVEWAGSIAAPSPAHVDHLLAAARRSDSAIGAQPMLVEYLETLRSAEFAGIENMNLATALAVGMQRLDWSLGLDYQVLQLSPMLVSEPWLAFVHHVLADCAEFGARYNVALAAYRAEQGISGHARPMPDLVFTPHSIECPFWLDDLGAGVRHRCTVEMRDGKLFLHVPYEDESLEIDPNAEAADAVRSLLRFLSGHNLRIAPRALTLTTFFRLFVADLFVHGIGGGRYDQITDRLVRDYFGIAPPPFAVSTATLYLPRAVGRTRACVPCVLQEGHRLKHGLLGAEKMSLVEEIRSLPRNSLARRDRYFAMQRRLQSARQATTLLRDWSAKLDRTRAEAADDAVVFDRELFYAVQPRDRLAGMIERYRAAFRLT
jgi:hypothetical protein